MICTKLSYDEIKTVGKIEEAARIIIPPNREEYPYEPYEFSNTDELREYVKQAKAASIDSLYTQAKQFVREYNDQDEYKLILR